MRVGFDFDGTLAVWLPGVNPDYTSGQDILHKTAAVFSTVLWMRHQIFLGREVCIITGRPQVHAPWLRHWCHFFLDHEPPIHCRPGNVGLACGAQAEWKASVLRDLGVDVYVGDNGRIDEVAARRAGIPYLDAARLIGGEQPRIEDLHAGFQEESAA